MIRAQNAPSCTTAQERKVTLNDPFGRQARRNRQQYTDFRTKLAQQGIDDAAGIDRFARRISTTAGKLALLVAAVAGVASQLLPGAAAPIVVAATVVLIWLGTSYLQTRAMISEYSKEPRFETPQAGQQTDKGRVQEES